MQKNTIQLPTNNIQVIVIGEIHRDPAPNIIVAELIKKLKVDNDIPVIYCEEMSKHLQFSEVYQQFLHATNLTKQSFPNKYKEYYTVTSALKRPHIPCSQHNALADKLMKQYKFEDTREIFQFIIRLEANKERLNLYRTLQKYKIQYEAIDEAKEDHFKRELDCNYEQERVSKIAQDVYNVIKALNKKNSIIICHVGILHMLRFAAMLSNHLKEMPEVKIMSIWAHSAYVSDELDIMKENMEMFYSKDSKFITEIYKTLEYHDIHFEENYEAGSFQANVFDKLIEEVITWVKCSNYFVIPKWTNEKQELIIKLNGSVKYFQEDAALINVKHDLLTKDIRAKLDIDRRKLDLPNNFSLKKAFLESFPDITVKVDAPLSSTIMVTFPNQQLALVKDVVFNWETNIVKKYSELILSLQNSLSEVDFI